MTWQSHTLTSNKNRLPRYAGPAPRVLWLRNEISNFLPSLTLCLRVSVVNTFLFLKTPNHAKAQRTQSKKTH